MANEDTTESRETPPQRTLGHFPRWVWGVYLMLFAMSVPWYIPADAPLRLWLGLPHWVVISLVATLGVAVFTAFVIHFLWPDQQEPAD